MTTEIKRCTLEPLTSLTGNTPISPTKREKIPSESETPPSKNIRSDNQNHTLELNLAKLALPDESACTLNISIDADCFEVQVWTKERPDLHGKPIAVHNTYKIITSVNYEARKFGVKRGKGMMEDAKTKCPNIEFIPIPIRWGKANQKTLRDASYDIELAVREYLNLPKIKERVLQIAFYIISKDEMVFEVQFGPTENSSTLNYPITNTKEIQGDKQSNLDYYFRIGGQIAGDIINYIKLKTTYQCSAGVGGNDLIAKLASKINKPAGVTVILPNGVDELLKMVKFQDGPGLGGKLGEQIKSEFKKLDGSRIVTLFDLQEVRIDQLSSFTKGQKEKVHNLAYAKGKTKVEDKLHPEVSCTKTITASETIRTDQQLENQLRDLFDEFVERLGEELKRHKRSPIAVKLQLERTGLRNKIKKENVGADSFGTTDNIEAMFKLFLDLIVGWINEDEAKELQIISKIGFTALFKK